MNDCLYKIIKALILPVQRLPLAFHYKVGKVFEWICKRLLHYRRDIIVSNIARGFPEMKYKDVIRLADMAYRHLGEIFAEAIWFGGCAGRPGKLHKKRICEFVPGNWQALEDAFAANPAGVVVLHSHFGNWELSGGMLQYVYDIPQEELKIQEKDIYAVYKNIQSPFWDRFMNENRQAAVAGDFNGYVEMRQILHRALQNVRAGKRAVYIFPTDQYPYRGTKSCDIPLFLNQPAKSMVGAATLANKFGMAVFELGIDRLERGHYMVRLSKICDDASAMDPRTIMCRYYELLEAEVRSNPENYLWSHKRWK